MLKRHQNARSARDASDTLTFVVCASPSIVSLIDVVVAARCLLISVDVGETFTSPFMCITYVHLFSLCVYSCVFVHTQHAVIYEEDTEKTFDCVSLDR